MEKNTSQKLYKIIGEKIRAFRQGKMSQQQLANNLNLTRTSITNFETGNQRIQIDTLWKIAGFLDVTIQELLPTKEEVGTLYDELLEDNDKEWIESVIQDAKKEIKKDD